MSAAALPWVTAGLGALGLLKSGQAQHSQNALVQGGLAAEQPQLDAQKDILSLAQNYDPAAEDKNAIGLANQNAQAQLSQGLGNLSGQFSQAGGSPTGDTAFNVSATNMGNRVIDPLKLFQAQLMSSQTSRKIGALQSVFSAPSGQIAQNYFQAAQMQGAGADPSAALAMFVKGLGGFMGGAQQSGVGGTSTSDPNYGSDPTSYQGYDSNQGQYD